MAILIIPEILSKVSKTTSLELQEDASSVKELIDKICLKNPFLKKHLFYENGIFKDHFLIILNENIINTETKISNSDTIEIMLATAGGSNIPQTLSESEKNRYARHLILPNIGELGQIKIKNSKILVIGAGGLGSPILLYLAAVGVGTLGIIDFDTVEESNLQRQIIHSEKSINTYKVDSAKKRILSLNKNIKINSYNEPITEENIENIFFEYDLIVDACDNYKTRYLLNEYCFKYKKPFIYGSIHAFTGQIAVFNYKNSPCYACIFPSPPPDYLAPNNDNKGVLGVLPGVIGTLQATETIKIILDLHNKEFNSLIVYDLLKTSIKKINIRKNINCKICGKNNDLL